MKFIAYRQNESHNPYIFDTHKELGEHFGIAPRTLSYHLLRGNRGKWVLLSMKNSEFKKWQRGGENAIQAENDDEFFLNNGIEENTSDSEDTPEPEEPIDSEEESESEEKPLTTEEQLLFRWLLQHTIKDKVYWDPPEFIANRYFTATSARNWIARYFQTLITFLRKDRNREELENEPQLCTVINNDKDSWKLQELKRNALGTVTTGFYVSPELSYYSSWLSRFDDRIRHRGGMLVR